MNPDPKKLRHLQQEAVESIQHQQQASGGREFATPEELLRYDAARTSPPGSVVERLNHSLAREPAKPVSWWKRLFS